MQRFRNILVVCDENSAWEHAFDRVEWLAVANGAEVTLIDVVDAKPGELSRLFAALPGGRAHEVEDRVLHFHRDRLEKLAAPLRDKGVAVTCTVAQGTLFLQVIRQVLRGDHDLVIKGAQRSPDRPFLRGPDMHILRKCPCPVWILNARTEPRASHILAAVDPDPDDEGRDSLNVRILQLATSLAAQDGARLDVMNVWRVQEEQTMRHGLVKIADHEIDAILAKEERDSRARLDNLVSGFLDHAGRMRILHLKGIAADVIPEHVEAEGVDTVVMGTLGHTGVAGLFIGNTAETILTRVACSVLTVKPHGFVSPVTLEDRAD